MQPLWETIWQLFKKLNIHLPQDPEILLLGIYPREMKTLAHTDLHTNAHGSIIHNSQQGETTRMSTGR